MNGNLDITPLRSLIAVADAGGVHRAAVTLRLSQSAVSQHLRRLERVVGQPVLEPAGRGARLSRAGTALLTEAREIVGVHDAALRRLAPGGVTRIVLGATDHAADHLLPLVVAGLEASAPGIEVSFRLDRTARLTEEVERGAVDVAVVISEAGGSGATPVGTLPLVWCAAPTWRPPAVRVPWPLLAIEAPCVIRARALAALAEQGLTSRVVGEAAHLGGVLYAVRAGFGVALLAAVGPLPDGLVPVPQLRPVPGVEVAVRGRADADPALVATVRATLRSVLAGVVAA